MTKKIQLLSIVAIAAVLIAGSLAVSPMAFAGDDDDDDGDDNPVLCPTDITGPVDGDVSVVAGGVDPNCTVTTTGSVEEGNIIVEGAGTWLVLNGDLDGDIEANECLFVVVRGDVDGDIEAEECNGNFFGFAIILTGTPALGFAHITGDVEVEESNLFIGPGVTVDGNVEVEDGVCLISPLATINGDLEGTCDDDDDSSSDDD